MLRLKLTMPDKSPINKNQSGQILIEALVAITIATVGLLGIFNFLSRSLSLNRVVADRYVATNLAAEGIELVKNLIDTNVIQGLPWNSGLASGDFEMDYTDAALRPYSPPGDPLRLDSLTGYYSYSTGENTNQRRKISIDNISPNEIKVVSRVDWVTRDNATFNIELEDHFFNWRQAAAP